MPVGPLGFDYQAAAQAPPAALVAVQSPETVWNSVPGPVIVSLIAKQVPDFDNADPTHTVALGEETETIFGSVDATPAALKVRLGSAASSATAVAVA